MSRPVVIAAGGTGGHMFPALALAAELEQRGQPVLLACDQRGARYLPAGMRARMIRAASPSGSMSMRLRGVAELALGFAQSLAFLQPAAAAGGGGVRRLRLGAGRPCRPGCWASRPWSTSRTPCSAAPTG